jgi:hypothetical protein
MRHVKLTYDRGNQQRTKRRNSHLKTIKIATVALIATAPVAVTIALPATAHADLGEFQSPSGNVYCHMGVGNDGKGSVLCQGGRGFVVGKPPGCDHLAWGDRFSLEQGSAPVSHCHGDTIVPPHTSPGPNPDVPILEFGQTSSAGTITCDSEPTGMTCTDSSTGHYFRMSRESNELG